jgi:hypothetical protein
MTTLNPEGILKPVVGVSGSKSLKSVSVIPRSGENMQTTFNSFPVMFLNKSYSLVICRFGASIKGESILST